MCLPSARAISISSLRKLCHEDLHLWNTAECVCLVRAIIICSQAALECCRTCLPSTGQQNVMENGVTAILQNVFTFCKGNNMQSGITVSLEYCRTCLPSVRAIICSYGKPRHSDTAECVYLLSGL